MLPRSSRGGGTALTPMEIVSCFAHIEPPTHLPAPTRPHAPDFRPCLPPRPQILEERQHLSFHLQQQRLIELIRRGDVEGALDFAQEFLAPRGEENVRIAEWKRSARALCVSDHAASLLSVLHCVVLCFLTSTSVSAHTCAAGVSARAGAHAGAAGVQRRRDEPTGEPSGKPPETRPQPRPPCPPRSRSIVTARFHSHIEAVRWLRARVPLSILLQGEAQRQKTASELNEAILGAQNQNPGEAMRPIPTSKEQFGDTVHRFDSGKALDVQKRS